MKLKKIAILMMAGMMAGSCIGCTQKNPVEQVQENTNIYDFEFTIGEEKYQIPSKVSDFTDNGWSFKNKDISDLDSNQALNFQLIKDKKTITLNLINKSNEKKNYKDCQICGIQINYTDDNNVAVNLGKKLSVTSKIKEKEITEQWGKSTETIKNQFGTTVKYTQAPNVGYLFDFNKDGVLFSFRIENLNFTDTDKKATKEEIEKMNKYTKPESLSDNPFDFVYNLEGVVYKLPTPVSVFLDNGWKIAESPENIAAETNLPCGLILEKDKQKITLTVSNATKGTVKCENAIVTEIFMNEFLDSNIEFELSSGIKLGITEDELKEKVDLSIFKSTTDQNNITSYVFSEANRFMSFDIRDGKLFNMCIKNK